MTKAMITDESEPSRLVPSLSIWRNIHNRAKPITMPGIACGRNAS